MRSAIKQILIVDDNMSDRHIYNRYLSQDVIWQYRIVESNTGQEGLEQICQQFPELILLDFSLPDMDGLEFIQQLKTNFDHLPPIIMLTREGDAALAVKAMKAGVNDYLIKNKTNGESLRLAVHNALEQDRLQKLAQHHEQRFRVSVENMRDCFGIYTSIRNQSGKIVGFNSDYLNESACQNNLFARPQPTEDDIAQLVAANPQAKLFEQCCQVVSTGRSLAREYSVTSKSLENSLSRTFEIIVNKLDDGFVAVWRDISDRIKMEQALRQSEAKFRVLVNQAPVGIFQTDCLGDCVFANPRWLEIAGMSLPEAVGKGWSKALHPDDCSRVYREWYQAAQSGTEFASEYRFQSSRGKITWVAGRAVAMQDAQGKRSGYFGTIIDITERKQVEALLNKQKEQLINVNRNLKQTTFLLQKRNRELDEFTSIVSHDLKAPLRAIANLSVWLEEDLQDNLEEDTKHNLELLRNRVSRMQLFIESLLEYSRVGRETAPQEEVLVADLLVDLVDSLAPPSTLEINIGKMPIVNTQKTPLQQVFSNLISNAIKHHPSQKGTISISAIEDDKYYYFSVTDDGLGIAAQDRERIFGIFQTLSSRDEHNNTGIGLSIVKKVVEKQGGTVELDSEVGKGTTFRFSWLK